MEKLNLKLITVGSRKVPEGWHISHRTQMQRLYYIKGGTGFMSDSRGGRAPFEKGKIYIHPYNLQADFLSDPKDPIDHIYFDFLSTPPIISNTPIVYDLPQNSAALALLRATEAFCEELGQNNHIEPGTNFLPPNMLSKSSEYGHIFREILSALLSVLSYREPIPFSGDGMIVDTLDTIRKNYMHPISVTQLAAAAGFEVHHFIRRFKRMMGVTPFAYLRAYRLIKARELIGRGMSITSAAPQVGYDSPTALSRALKQDEWE